MPGTNEHHKKMVLELRRVIILALVGGTPKSNPSLDRVLETNYLEEVKAWLDDVLSGTVGKSISVVSPSRPLVLNLSFMKQAELICCFIS